MKKIIKIMVPPGKYFIGDPGYVFDDASWSEMCDKNMKDPIWEYEGKKFIIVSVGGDGEYFDNKKHSYLVDSGSLGIVPFDMITIPADSYRDLGNVVEFEKPELFTYIDEELFVIADIFIRIIGVDSTYFDEVDKVEKEKYWEVLE